MREIVDKFIKTNQVLDLFHKDANRKDIQQFIKENNEIRIDEAIILIMAIKAMKGDTRAAEMFMKYNIEPMTEHIDHTSDGGKIEIVKVEIINKPKSE